MKTFADLIHEVQEPGLCHQCGGCVAFCTAINYGALEVGADGKPRYSNREKCIECGICYSICPVIQELEEDTKELVSWSAPIGRVMGNIVGRATDLEVRAQATDGGVITALLLHLFDRGRIDAAVVSKTVGPFQRRPWLALTREDIVAAAGFHFDTLPSITHFTDFYTTYSPSISGLGDVAPKALKRVAFVGTPCQINALRRMEVLGVVPADAIKFHFGLFCAGNFQFGAEQRQRLEQMGRFTWDEVKKVNLKEELLIHLKNGEIRPLPLNQLDFMKRHACRFCDDYTAEFADLSFGGLGAPEGWTSIIIRSPLGRAILASASGADLELFSYREDRNLVPQALAKILEWSDKKKQAAAEYHQQLEKKAV
ncbi:MAG: Coenzyme F420 hydrogenase/dehydrogenase, beta subunit C-terminal domain [Thermodesulfobacteriota bacterium]